MFNLPDFVARPFLGELERIMKIAAINDRIGESFVSAFAQSEQMMSFVEDINTSLFRAIAPSAIPEGEDMEDQSNAEAHGSVTAEGSATGFTPEIRVTRTVTWMRSDRSDPWEVRVMGSDGGWLDLGVGNREDAILDVIMSLLPSDPDND